MNIHELIKIINIFSFFFQYLKLILSIKLLSKLYIKISIILIWILRRFQKKFLLMRKKNFFISNKLSVKILKIYIRNAIKQSYCNDL